MSDSLKERPFRKVTSTKFNVTLPQDWREANELSPGDNLRPYYESNSPLILVPEKRELTDWEKMLINLLVNGLTFTVGDSERIKQILNHIKKLARILKRLVESSKD